MFSDESTATIVRLLPERSFPDSAALLEDYGIVRQRYYDPAVGKWLSEDPIGFAGGQANLEEYVGNDPLNFTDPSGEQAQEDESQRVNPQQLLSLKPTLIGNRGVDIEPGS